MTCYEQRNTKERILAFLLQVLKSLFVLSVEICQLLKGLEGEGSCHCMVSTPAVCLDAISAHSQHGGTKSLLVFQIVASLWHSRSRASSLEPREPYWGGLWERKLSTSRDEVIIASYCWLHFLPQGSCCLRIIIPLPLASFPGRTPQEQSTSSCSRHSMC